MSPAQRFTLQAIAWLSALVLGIFYAIALWHLRGVQRWMLLAVMVLPAAGILIVLRLDDDFELMRSFIWRPICIVIGGAAHSPAGTSAIAPAIAPAVTPAAKPVVTIHRGVTSALACAWAHARPDESVLFSPAFASFDQYANFRERAEEFRTWARTLARGLEGSATLD